MDKFSNKIASFDLDSTLSDSTHRHHMIDRSKQNGSDFWNDYSLQGQYDDDGPALPLARFFSELHIPWVIVSGRSEIARDVTMQWLRKRQLTPACVYLCDDRHNTMSHSAWKIMRLLEVQEETEKRIAFHIDDADSIGLLARSLNNPDVPPIIMTHAAGRLTDFLG